MDLLGDLLTTRPIQTGWEFTKEPYLSGQYGLIDNLDRQIGNSSVSTRTGTRSSCPETLLTLPIPTDTGNMATVELSERHNNRKRRRGEALVHGLGLGDCWSRMQRLAQQKARELAQLH
jgi:hypothetical protein